MLNRVRSVQHRNEREATTKASRTARHRADLKKSGSGIKSRHHYDRQSLCEWGLILTPIRQSLTNSHLISCHVKCNFKTSSLNNLWCIDHGNRMDFWHVINLGLALLHFEKSLEVVIGLKLLVKLPKCVCACHFVNVTVLFWMEQRFTRNCCKKRLFFVQRELWRTEWVKSRMMSFLEPSSILLMSFVMLFC